jgi:glycosyltransferase involved in cell wall biosynthesis
VKITHLHSTFATPWGGAEAYLFALASAQWERGHDVEIVTAVADGASIGRAAAAGIRVTIRPTWRPYAPDRRGSSPLARVVFHGLDLVHAVRRPRTYRHVQDARDIVHVHRFQGVGASMLRARHAPVVHTAHDFCLVDTTSTTLRDGLLPSRLNFTQRLRARVVARSAGDATVIVFPSERTRLRHADLGFLTGRSLIRVVPHGWPTSPPSADEAEIPPRPRFVFLGRLHESKGIDLLLRAWNEAQLDAELVIAGDGPGRASVQAAARDGIRYVGWVDAEAKTALIRSATALVFPSLWPETFGLVIAESLLLGRPVVATPPAAGELVTDGQNGVVSTDVTPSALADALRRIANDPALRETVTAGAAASAVELDFDRHVDRIDAIYREARDAFDATV